MVATWSTFELEDLLPDVIHDLSSTITGTRNESTGEFEGGVLPPILAILDILQTTLDLIKTLLQGAANVLFSLFLELLDAVDEFIEAISASGIHLLYIRPDTTNGLKSIFESVGGGSNAFKQRIIDSFNDTNDPRRPTFPDDTKAGMYVIAADSGELTNLIALIQKLAILFGQLSEVNYPPPVDTQGYGFDGFNVLVFDTPSGSPELLPTKYRTFASKISTGVDKVYEKPNFQTKIPDTVNGVNPLKKDATKTYSTYRDIDTEKTIDTALVDPIDELNPYIESITENNHKVAEIDTIDATSTSLKITERFIVIDGNPSSTLQTFLASTTDFGFELFIIEDGDITDQAQAILTDKVSEALNRFVLTNATIDWKIVTFDSAGNSTTSEVAEGEFGHLLVTHSDGTETRNIDVRINNVQIPIENIRALDKVRIEIKDLGYIFNPLVDKIEVLLFTETDVVKEIEAKANREGVTFKTINEGPSIQNNIPLFYQIETLDSDNVPVGFSQIIPITPVPRDVNIPNRVGLSPFMIGTQKGPFIVVKGQNDVLSYTINDKSVNVTIRPSRTHELEQPILYRTLNGHVFTVQKGESIPKDPSNILEDLVSQSPKDGSVKFEIISDAIKISTNNLSTKIIIGNGSANPLLGFFEGQTVTSRKPSTPPDWAGVTMQQLFPFIFPYMKNLRSLLISLASPLSGSIQDLVNHIELIQTKIRVLQDALISIQELLALLQEVFSGPGFHLLKAPLAEGGNQYLISSLQNTIGGPSSDSSGFTAGVVLAYGAANGESIDAALNLFFGNV